ncbi:MAG: hypothetical protein ACYCWW_03945 [Deltaproteobacteria bacterium]
MSKKSEAVKEAIEVLGYEPQEPTSESEESVWEQKLPEIVGLEVARKEKEERDAAADSQGFFERELRDPRSIAQEMKARSDCLRSRPMGPGWLARRELEVLLGLDLVEAKARALALQLERSLVEGGLARKELDVLNCSAFAARDDHAALVRLLDEAIPQRVKPQDPEARRRELELIETFLREKRAREESARPGWPKRKKAGG